ncbi:hypothetical protein RSAG8_13690, partial [Rhizoctonia solani AG-8 WAC10335]
MNQSAQVGISILSNCEAYWVCSRRDRKGGYRRGYDPPMHFKDDRLAEEWPLPGISAHCPEGLLQ